MHELDHVVMFQKQGDCGPIWGYMWGEYSVRLWGNPGEAGESRWWSHARRADSLGIPFAQQRYRFPRVSPRCYYMKGSCPPSCVPLLFWRLCLTGSCGGWHLYHTIRPQEQDGYLSLLLC